MCLGETVGTMSNPTIQRCGWGRISGSGSPPSCFYLTMPVYPSACSEWSVNPSWVTAGISKYGQSWRCGPIEDKIAVWFKALNVNSRNIIGLALSMRRENTQFLHLHCIHIWKSWLRVSLSEEPLACTPDRCGYGQRDGHVGRKGGVREELGLLRYSDSHLSLSTHGTWAVKKPKSRSLKKSRWSQTTSAYV